MGSHILYGSMTPSIATSDEGWYGVAAQVGKRVNKRAARGDIRAVIGKHAGHDSPACFIPSLAEMHLNTVDCPMGDPDKVDLYDRLWKLEHAPAIGAMDHEAAHAKHTKFDPRELMDDFGATRKMIDVITTLEEPRIEANAVRSRPSAREFIRPMAVEIVAHDFDIGDTRYSAAASAGLLLARVDAGVFDRADVRTFRTDIRKILGETLDDLEPLWQRFLRLRDDDFEGMVDIAREWLDVLGEDPNDSRGMVGKSMMGAPLPGDARRGRGRGRRHPQGVRREDQGQGAQGRGRHGRRDSPGTRRRARRACRCRAQGRQRAQGRGQETA